MPLDVRALVLKNEFFSDLETHRQWDYSDMQRHAGRRSNWISFDCLAYNAADDSVYCGITDFSNDIFYRYSLKECRFECLNYRTIANPYDAKFHRSLELDKDGVLWAATALLHDVDHYHDAPGGAIVRYCTRTGSLEKVCIPLPHLYIQALVLDRERRLLHGVTFTPEKLFTYKIETGEVIDHGLIGSGCGMAQPERPTLDARGRLWCTWGVTRAFMNDPGPHPIRLLCLDPDTNRLTFFQHGIPQFGAHDDGRVEGMFNGRDGYVYLGSKAGGLFRLNPETAAVQYLGKPVAGERITSMTHGPDGAIYFASGRPDPHIVRFLPGPDRFEVLGLIRDERIGEQAFQIHDICCTADGRLFAGENDNFRRSSYLWECTLREG